MFWEGSSYKLNPENFLFLIICSSRTLERVFGLAIKRIWQYVRLGNCSQISELDVRLLNISILTLVD